MLRGIVILCLMILTGADVSAKDHAGRQAGAVPLSGWVQICSGSGVSYVWIGEGEPDTAPNAPPESDDCTCLLCSCCPVADGAAMAVGPALAVVEPYREFTVPLFTFGADALFVPAEQFWAISRGPPDLKEMTT